MVNFLKIISFWVRVPVLSVRRYWMRPRSSGIVEFLGTVPGIDSSLEIW